MLAAWAIIDGVGLPEVGLSTGWVLMFFAAIQFVRGKILTIGTHEEAVKAMRAAFDASLAAKDREMERVDHDRQEWRTESRIKDAQLAEKDAQLAEQAKQISAMAELGRTLEATLAAIRPQPGGST